MKITITIVKISFYLILLTFLSCQQKINDNSCENLEKKVDSLTSLNTAYENSSMYKFYKILNAEKKSNFDTILIKEYEKLIGKDELLDLYVWDRIHTIKTNNYKDKIIKNLVGTYVLKPNHNNKDTKITSIRINIDSCFMYKNKTLVKGEKIKFKNSSNKFIKGKLIIDNYKISISDVTEPKILILDDNLCMDCETLQFLKKN